LRQFIVGLTTIICAVFVGNISSAQTSTTIRLTNGEWEPYLSKKLPHNGFASHIVTEAFALVGIKVEYNFFPWSRAYKLAKEGKWDGTVVWLDTSERRRDFHYSDPVVPSKNAFFLLKYSTFNWDSLEDLKDVRIGGTLTYAYGEAFDAAEKAGIFKTDRARSDELGVRKLIKGRIDVFPGELMVTYSLIRKMLPPDTASLLSHHPKLIQEQPQYLLLSKKVEGSAALRDMFNRGLKKLKASGRYDQIIADALAGKYASHD